MHDKGNSLLISWYDINLHLLSASKIIVNLDNAFERDLQKYLQCQLEFFLTGVFYISSYFEKNWYPNLKLQIKEKKLEGKLWF